jgi:hypothetical protein
MKRTPEKHLPYLMVLEAFQKAKGCAMCEMEAAATHRYLDSLLYESVNDPGVREDLLRSRGYCLRHAHLLLGFQDGLGTAILYQDQVRLFLGFLAGLQGMKAKVLKKKGAAAWGRHQTCPACRLQVEGREYHTDVLLEGLAHEEMRAALEACPGLCVPHFLLTLDRTRDAERQQYLIELEERRFRELLGELQEFCRKHDYRFHQEGFGKEGDSWIRAVRMLTGYRDVFGT